jgi:hypothetical protein
LSASDASKIASTLSVSVAKLVDNTPSAAVALVSSAVIAASASASFWSTSACKVAIASSKLESIASIASILS